MLDALYKEEDEARGLKLKAHLIYRWLIGAIFLFVAFSSFPDHKWPIGLGYLVLSQAIVGVGLSIEGLLVASTRLIEASSMQTRHMILVAAEHTVDGKVSASRFWPEVNHRVRSDIEDQTVSHMPLGRAKSFFAIAAGLLWTGFSEMVGIAIIAGLTPSY